MDEKYDPANLLLQGQRFNLLKKKKVNHSRKKLLLKE